MIIGRLNKSQDGVIHDLEVEISCLSAGHGNVPKIILNEQIHNAVRSGHDTDTQNGGDSLTKKHCWDMVKVIQVNESKESGEKQPYQQNRIYDADGIAPALHQLSDRMNIKVKCKTEYEITCNCGEVFIGTLSTVCPGCKNIDSGTTNEVIQTKSVIVKAVTETRTDEAKQIRKESMKEGKDFSPRRGKTIKLREDDNANTVTSTQGIEQTIAINGLMEGFRIRRLTEIECERLQGLPDNWTKYGNYDGVVKEISRTQRYKMCGNAVTKDIVEIIGIKLINKLKN